MLVHPKVDWHVGSADGTPLVLFSRPKYPNISVLYAKTNERVCLSYGAVSGVQLGSLFLSLFFQK